jgi:hypothetical protein
MLKHMFGKKDTLALRRDMEAVGKFKHLHLQEVARTNDWLQSKAPYVLTDLEKLEFLALVSSTRVPSRYNSTLIKHTGESHLAGLKSHDHHYLL